MSIIKASNISMEVQMRDDDGYMEYIPATVDVYLHIDSNYGADVDGNRGSTVIFIEDFQVLTLEGIEYRHLSRKHKDEVNDAVNDALEDYDFSDYILGRK